MPHPFVASLRAQLSLPVICAPMFIVSTPRLVIAQCLAGVVGAMPALNARPASQLDEWLHEISLTLDGARQAGRPLVAPFAVNQIIHPSNNRLEADMAVCAKHRVPLIITSLSAPGDIVPAVHAWGGRVLHDVTTLRHAEKALEAGVDGLILVCAGAGGHAGTLSPFALLAEVRKIYDGLVVLSGAISTGSSVLAAQAMGADFAYLGTRFIASEEANAAPGYKEMIVRSRAADIHYTPYFTGIPGNYLAPSIVAAGLNPIELMTPSATLSGLGSTDVKAWRDVWGAGQGVGSIDSIEPVSVIVDRLRQEYTTRHRTLMQEVTA